MPDGSRTYHLARSVEHVLLQRLPRMLDRIRFQDQEGSRHFAQRVRVGGDRASGKEAAANDCDKYKEKGWSVVLSRSVKPRKF